MTTRNLPLIERFMLGVDKRGGAECWQWTKSISRSGYGQIRVDGRSLQTHRLSYELCVGSIPDGMFVCHQCDNRACVNPGHLFLGTAGDNNADRHAKGRSRGARHFGETNPSSKLTAEKVREIRSCDGTQKEIAERFGIVFQTVSDIRRGRIWKHVP